MSHIIEFSIKGLAGRDSEYKATLNRDVNVFFGLNGCGKTSLLKILHSAMSNDASILKDVPFSEAIVLIYSITYEQIFEHKIKKPLQVEKTKSSKASRKGVKVTLLTDSQGESLELFEPDSTNLTDEFKWKIEPALKDNIGRWSHKYLPISRLYVGTISTKSSVSVERLLSEDQLDARFSDLLQSVWLTYSFDINSRVNKAQADGIANILQELLTPSNRKKISEVNISAKEALSRVSNFLVRQNVKVKLNSEDFMQRYSSSPEFKNIVFDIDTIETQIESAMSPINKLNTIVSQLMGSTKKIQFSGREIGIQAQNGTAIRPHLLSSGEKQLLKLLIEVVSASSNSVIIDEPELSMHIDWQKNLLENMNALNPDCQLIVATHSPEIMSNLEDSKIFRI